MSWSESDNYFVSGSLKVYSVDLSSEPLKLVPEENVKYDGPLGNDFKSLLLQNGFRVNRQGKTIVRVPKRDDEEDYNFFLLEKVVPLGPYGFTNEPSPTQDVKVLKSLLDETRADLAKKNAEVDELHRNWNSELLRLTMDAITESMKKVFVDVDLKPSATGGDPMITVVGFLEKLRSLFLEKEFGATFLGAANQILSSIVSIFDQRNGTSYGMDTSLASRTPADLIQNLIILREFVETHFFIDGSVMVKAYGLMNEKDIPMIFRDSEEGVAELHRKEIGAKSIDNIDGESIFYGYFNIPSVGKFKGVLTRVDVTLPDEIMVKLSHRPNPNQLDEKRFWFVKANGETIFEKPSSPPPESSSSTDVVDTGSKVGFEFPPPESKITGFVNTGTSNTGSKGVDFLGFLRRMNKTFVNKQGTYLKFEFTATKYIGSPHIHDEKIFYYNATWKVFDPISRVQYDMNEKPLPILERRVALCEEFVGGLREIMTSGSFVTDRLGVVCAFVFKDSCFIGKITEVSGLMFRENAMVSKFFEQFQLGPNCFVDSVATTFFVLTTNRIKWWRNRRDVAPQFVS